MRMSRHESLGYNERCLAQKSVKIVQLGAEFFGGGLLFDPEMMRPSRFRYSVWPLTRTCCTALLSTRSSLQEGLLRSIALQLRRIFRTSIFLIQSVGKH